MALPEIRIKPKVKSHGLFITVFALVSLMILGVVGYLFWWQAKLVLMFLFTIAMAGLTLGLTKLMEPNFSFSLSPKQLKFNHRKGHWQINWRNISRIFPITNTVGIDRQELNYIGLSLLSLDDLKSNISIRLANHLIHEQQPLLTYCVANELIKPEQGVINFESYHCDNGEELKGPIAGFFHQCKMLKQALGAHIYIAEGNVDRPLEDFAVLLRQCQTASVNYLAK